MTNPWDVPPPTPEGTGNMGLSNFAGALVRLAVKAYEPNYTSQQYGTRPSIIFDGEVLADGSDIGFVYQDSVTSAKTLVRQLAGSVGKQFFGRIGSERVQGQSQPRITFGPPGPSDGPIIEDWIRRQGGGRQPAQPQPGPQPYTPQNGVDPQQQEQRSNYISGVPLGQQYIQQQPAGPMQPSTSAAATSSDLPNDPPF